MSNATALSEYRTEAARDGYRFECSCGELYNSIGAASSCRKCRNYCVFGYCTHVTDIVTGLVVAGTEPSVEEYQAAELEAVARWEAERLELDRYIAMCRGEGEEYEAEVARLAAIDAELAEQERLEGLWMVQDQLMGIR